MNDFESPIDVISDAQKPMNTVAGGSNLGLSGHAGWYRETENGAGSYHMGEHREQFVQDFSDRTMYITTTYAEDKEPVSYEWKDGSRTWNGEKPLPNYSELKAFSLFADVDMSSELKEARDKGEHPQARIEEAIEGIEQEFAELAGDEKAVSSLDSVGGLYAFLDPTMTVPICERYDGIKKSDIIQEVMKRFNQFLDKISARYGFDGFEADLLNNINRQYKAPGSRHKSIEGLTWPYDGEYGEPVRPNKVKTSTVHSKIREFAEDFTCERNKGLVENLVRGLFPEFDGSWHERLNAWHTAAEAESELSRRSEMSQEERRAELEKRARERGCRASQLERTNDMQDVIDAANEIRTREVAERYAASYYHDDRPSQNQDAFDPWWRESNSGKGAIVYRDDNRFMDHDGQNGGYATMLFAMSPDSDTLPSTGRYLADEPHPSGADFMQLMDEMRDAGFDIPIYTGEPESKFNSSSKNPRLPGMRNQSGASAYEERAHDHVMQTVKSTFLNPITGDMETEFPMRSQKSGTAAEGASPDDRRMHITPNKGDARSSAREYGPDNQIETIPSTDSWLANHDVVGDEFKALISGGFQASRARAYLMQKYDLSEPEVQPYFEQYEEEPTADLILSSPGVDAVQHWNEYVDTIVFDDVHPLIEYTKKFQLDDTEYAAGVRAQLDKVIRALPVQAKTLDELVYSFSECRRVVNDISLVTSPAPDTDQFNLMALSQQANGVSRETWTQLKIVIEAETGIEATPYNIKRVTRRDNRFVYFDDPMYAADTNIVIMSGDNPPYMTEWFFQLIGRESPSVVSFKDTTLQAYWKVRKHTVLVARDIENTRSGGNIGADQSRQLEEMAEAKFGEEAVTLDTLKSFERRGISRDEVRENDDMMNFGNTRGNPKADSRDLGVVHGSSYWPNFVEDMCALAGVPAELKQEANKPLQAVHAGTDEENEVAQSLLLWMKQAEATQAAARIGSATDNESFVIVGTRHISPQFNSYDISDQVKLLSEAEEETVSLIEEGFDTIRKIAEVRGVTQQAAGHILNKLVERGIVEKSEFSGEYGEHGFSESGDNKIVFTVPSQTCKHYLAPLADYIDRGEKSIDTGEATTQMTLDEAIGESST